MGILDIFLLAIALAMDCFTVSLVGGVLLGRRRWAVILRMSFLFGFFQALMPLLGWLLTNHFSGYIEAFDHWVAFALLVFLGVRMILSGLGGEEADTPRQPNRHCDPARLSTQLSWAVATSIDALAVGISLACTDYNDFASLAFPLTVIGAVSMAFGVAGNLLGLRFGRALSRRLRPELVGGIILIAIGLKILLNHLCA